MSLKKGECHVWDGPNFWFCESLLTIKSGDCASKELAKSWLFPTILNNRPPQLRAWNQDLEKAESRENSREPDANRKQSLAPGCFFLVSPRKWIMLGCPYFVLGVGRRRLVYTYILKCCIISIRHITPILCKIPYHIIPNMPGFPWVIHNRSTLIISR